MKKRSRKAVAAASIEERPRPSRATEEWEYIHAPIVGYSDDSTDKTYVLSSTDEEEEESDVLSTIDDEEEEDEEEEEEEDTDTNDEADSEADSEDELPTGSMARHAEEDILPSVESGSGSESGSESESESGSGSDESGTDEPPTSPRKLKRGRAGEATEQRTGPRPAKKRRHGKAKETPVVNPYLERIAREREQAEFGVFRVGKCRCFRC
jgi:hypothetical protein